MKKRLFSLLLVMALLLTVCVPFASAEDTDGFDLVIDLTGYTGPVSGTYSIDYFNNSSQSFSLLANTRNVIPLTLDILYALDSTFTLEVPNILDWQITTNAVVNKTETADSISCGAITQTDGELPIFEIKSNQITVCYQDDYCVGLILDAFNQADVDKVIELKYAPQTSNYSVAVQSANPEYGSVSYQAAQANTYILSAQPNEGYVFDYWQADHSEEKITENPYTVTLTQDTTYTAYFKEAYQLTVAVAEGCENMGQVSSQVTADNAHVLTATAKDGYIFDYWLKDNSQEPIKTNPYTAVLTGDTTYTAYFRKPYTAIVAVAEGCEGMGTVSARWSNNDTWSITATPAEGFGFTGWNDGNQSSSRSVTLTEDTTFTASFVRSQVTEITDIRVSVSGQSENPDDSAAAAAQVSLFSSPMRAAAQLSDTEDDAGVPLKKGTDVTAQIYFSLNASVGDKYPHGQVLLYAGEVTAANEAEATLLARRVGTIANSVSGSSYITTVSLNDLPLLPDGKLTAVLYTDTAEPYEKVYKTINVQVEDTAETLELSYLTTPEKAAPTDGGISALDRGPNIFGGIAFMDGETGAMSLYLAGHGGVYELQYGQETDLVIMPGQEDIFKSGDNDAMRSGALAVGGPSADDLTALIRIAGNTGTSYELRHYNGETWTKIENSDAPSQALNSLMDGKCAIVMDANDVWAGSYHWDGTSWVQSGMNLTSVLRMDASNVYATTSDGLYRYENKSWTKIDLEGVESGFILRGGDRSGQLILSKHRYSKNYPVDLWQVDVSGTSPAVKVLPTVTADVLGSRWTLNGPEFNGTVDSSSVMVFRGAGIMPDGSVYIMIGRQYGSYMGGSYLLRLEDGKWKLVDVPEFEDARDAVGKKYRPNGVNAIWNLADSVTVFTGLSGSVYLANLQNTITFDPNGGTCEVTKVSGSVWTTVEVPTPVREGYTFKGWFYDTQFEKPWTNFVIPTTNITLYAKWEDASETDTYAEDRAKALKQLENALERMDERDYTSENWAKVQAEYNNGVYAITVVEPKPASSSQDDINKAIQNTIYAALNNALARMNAVPLAVIKQITVAVSLDAQTLGLGYYVKPTLVTVDKYTRASVVITDLIKQAVQERYGLALEGHQEYHAGEPAGDYAYIHTGTVDDSFYLAEVYWPGQDNATVADYITEIVGESNIDYTDRDGKYLGEFDYYNMSGWMYSISNINNDEELPSFPGVGAAEWRMTDGEVMRWQYTVYGYGSDLNADNSEWGDDSITVNSGDKTALTYQIALMREAYKEASEEQTYQAGDDKLETSHIYVNVFENVLCDPLATDDELNDALKDLELVALELDNAEALSGVAGLIREIGTVTAESGDAIQAAREAYDALSETLQPVFNKAYPELIEALINAENAYKQIQDEETAKQAAAAVDELIEALPDPEKISRSDKEALDEALKAYENLSDAAKQYVTKYDKLVACKAAYDKLVHTTPVTPSKPSTTTPTEPADTVSYTDVAKSDWFYDSVLYVSEKGLMTGTGANSFSPNVSTTRGMIVTILARLEGVDTNKGGTWYEAGQKWAMENGISDGTNMTGEMTREQLATILYRYAKTKGYDVSKSNSLSSFTDSGKVSDWALEAMQWANAEGLINGKGADLLDPQGKATRAETAAILMRFMKNVAKLDD